MRRALLTAALLGLALPALAATHNTAPKKTAAPKTADVNLALDEVHTLIFRAPVATVYVGNPSIADVTMIDARHAFVQGKGYGHTNIVALNHNNVQVFSSYITVTGDQTGSTVVLNRGAQRITLSCAGQRCEPTPMPGDGKNPYDPSNPMAAMHQSEARTAAASDNAH